MQNTEIKENRMQDVSDMEPKHDQATLVMNAGIWKIMPETQMFIMSAIPEKIFCMSCWQGKKRKK